MTEKRFTILSSSIDYYEYWDTKEEKGLTKDEVVELLNALHEENQYLQTRIQMLEGVMNTQHYYQKIADNRTDEVFQIRQIIKEAYENERTQIGKNVLKQLIDKME